MAQAITAEATFTRPLTVSVNGEARSTEVETRLLLVHFLRETLGLTGTHMGCDTTSCGACTVLLDGVPVKSCTVFAVQAEGHDVTTVEGLETADGLHPIQQAFHEEHGLQCGFCTPGMMLTATALLRENPNPTDEEIRWALSGNICRCTGYQNIVKAVHNAAAKLAGQEVAAVVAETAYIAKDALELIDVDYEPLPAVTTPQQALEEGAPLIRDEKEGQTDNRIYHWEAGDKEATDRAFADADRVVSLD